MELLDALRSGARTIGRELLRAGGSSGARTGLRKYEAAANNRRTRGWPIAKGSPSAELQSWNLDALRGRARYMAQNNAWANRAERLLANNVVGSGITPKPLTKDVDERELYRLGWGGWAETTECDAAGLQDFYGLQWQIMLEVVEAGEVLVRLRERRPTDGLLVPLQLQVLEADHLDTLKTQALNGGARIIQGVEFDALDRRVAYWLFPEHPGEVGLIPRSFQSVRVPASQVLHIFAADRAGQVRGVPRGAACLLALRDFDAFADAVGFRQVLANAFVGFVAGQSDDDPYGIGGETPATGEAATADEPEQEDFRPGTWRRLKMGETVTFSDPPEPENFEAYSRVTLRQIAAGYGVSYEALANDLRGVNFSSGRMGWIEFQREIVAYQMRVLRPRLLQPVWQAFTRQAALAGVVNERVPATWQAPRRAMLDPVKELRAISEGVRTRMFSWQGAQRQLSADPDQVRQEFKEDDEAFAALGLDSPGEEPTPATLKDSEGRLGEVDVPEEPVARS